MNRPLRAALIVLSIFLSAPSVFAQDDIEPHLLSDLEPMLEQVETRADSIALLDAGALLRIVDTSCYDGVLYKVSRLHRPSPPERFFELFNECRQANPTLWTEVDRRCDYARSHCETPIYFSEPDLRWELFIRYGPPSAEWSMPTDCAGRGGGDCLTFIYSWGAQNRQVICQSSADGWYPQVRIESEIGWDDSRRPVYPIVQPLVFPGSDSTFDVWVSAWIRGGDFTGLSLLDGLTHIELVIKNAERRIVGGDTLIADLRLLRSVLSVTQDKDAIMAMAYLSCPHLAPGHYTMELKVAGSGMNYGTHKADLLVPSRFATRDLSDPVLLTTRVPKGEEVQPGIERGGETFYADPMRLVRQYDSMYVYHEFVIPTADDSPSEYKLTVTAFPQGKSGKRKGDKIEVGQIVDVQDTLGNPWGTTSRSGAIDIDDIEEPEGTRKLYEEKFRPNGPVYVFEHALSTKKLDPDKYWLQIAITDKKEERFFRTALTTITVK